MYRRNLELAETNQALSLLRTIDTLVLEPHESLQVLCTQISQAIAATATFPFVGILVHKPPAEQLQLLGWYANPQTVGELANAQLERVRLDANDPWLANQQATLFLHGTELATSELAKNLHVAGGSSEPSPLQALYLAKLMARKRLVGLMVIGFSGAHSDLQHSDQPLLERLSQAVGVAVDNSLLYEENQQVLRQLQQTNQKLRELDEAKDEFISMASHQLRTPLTSVKGYISMVLEGDAGKLAEPQSKLLNQAFISSQRMVYLIADLLNVSRLKTGKFIIEAKPTNLADVVEGELAQLVETAKGRKLELIYDKPKDFPTLMLDETKIRQVIMNFADNAIYYTPAGGHIKVNLVDTGSSVEFTVVDDGIGVPKNEQPQLFSKFYRAGNARQARPDGTGLGLFMAKKVIVAQGGALIFKTEEGKGSTFGFSFAKSKLQPLVGVTPRPNESNLPPAKTP